MQQESPPGATPVDLDELFAAIGELYFQVRTLRKMVSQAAPPAVPSDGKADAVHQ